MISLILLYTITLSVFIICNENYKQKVRRNTYLGQKIYVDSVKSILDYSYEEFLKDLLSTAWTKTQEKFTNLDDTEDYSELITEFKNIFYDLLNYYPLKNHCTNYIKSSDITKYFSFEEKYDTCSTTYFRVLYYENPQKNTTRNNETKVSYYRYSTICPEFNKEDIEDAFNNNWNFIIMRHKDALFFENTKTKSKEWENAK